MLSDTGFALLELYIPLYLLKTYGFREEREWRLISPYIFRGSDDLCFYRVVTENIVPYREYELLEGEEEPILEIVLGPKHITPNDLVERFMKQSGFKNVRVRRSDVTYR